MFFHAICLFGTGGGGGWRRWHWIGRGEACDFQLSEFINYSYSVERLFLVRFAYLRIL
jgi:hypothetical protein